MASLRTLLSCALLVALAGCAREDAPATPAPAAADASAPAADAPAPTQAPAPAAATTPAPVPLGDHDREVVHFRGFGPATFGADEETVRQAWGRPLQPHTLAGSQLCYYLEMDPRPEEGAPVAVSFMFEGGVLVRYDVDSVSPAAPGGFTVGASADDIRHAFGSRVTETPHKYIGDGLYLEVTPEFDEPGRLVFEVGADGRVTQWRIGLPPQVNYVEGCA